MRYYVPPKPDDEGDQWFGVPYDFFDHMDIALAQGRPEFITSDHTGPRLLIADGSKGIDDSDEEEWIAVEPVAKLPYKDGEVAEIACYNVLARLTADEIYAMLTEFERVLMTRGVLTIIVPAQGDPAAFGRTWFTTQTWPALIDREDGWAFSIGLNILFGYSEQSICLFTQLVRSQR